MTTSGRTANTPKSTPGARTVARWLARRTPDFPAYLLGNSLVDAERPVRLGRDRQETTHSLAALFLPAWRATPGAA